MATSDSEDGDPSLLQTLDTELCADSVEWCPHENLESVLLCGTYQLDENVNQNEAANRDEKTPQTRKGQLRVYNLRDYCSLTLGHSISMPGVLDIKWCSETGSSPVFGLVNATGHAQIWKLPDAEAEPENLAEVSLGDSRLGLALDWSRGTSSGQQVVASDSSGHVSVYDVDDGVSKVTAWHAHDFEAWICAYDKWNKPVIYSGGDDCLFKGWDLRVGSSPIFTNTRHSMGVCSIQSNPIRENILAVGSYDEELHIWDTRQFKRPLATCGVGGGIWRIKWEPFTGDRILTATMYNGFHILDASNFDEGKCSQMAHFECSSHLGYGADWCRLSPASWEADVSSHLIALCSFYNHSLQLRRWPT